MTTSSYPAPVNQLLTTGDPRQTGGWLDYPALGLGPDQIPDLIRMLLDEDLHWADSDSREVWAPLHAWRALGQLQAAATVEPLLSLLPRIDDHDDDWVGEEVPVVFGLIGPAAVPALAAYLADEARGLWARVAAAHGLSQIGQRHPAARAECLAALVGTLEGFAQPGRDPLFHGFLVSDLVAMKAVEAAPLPERAFAADQVDETVLGDWEDVQIELGLKAERERPFQGRTLFGPANPLIEQQRLQHQINEAARKDFELRAEIAVRAAQLRQLAQPRRKRPRGKKK